MNYVVVSSVLDMNSVILATSLLLSNARLVMDEQAGCGWLRGKLSNETERILEFGNRTIVRYG